MPTTVFFLRKIAEDGCSLSRWCISTVCDSENLLSIGESYPEWNRVRIVVRKSLKSGVSKA